MAELEPRDFRGAEAATAAKQDQKLIDKTPKQDLVQDIRAKQRHILYYSLISHYKQQVNSRSKC